MRASRQSVTFTDLAALHQTPAADGTYTCRFSLTNAGNRPLGSAVHARAGGLVARAVTARGIAPRERARRTIDVPPACFRN